MKAKEVRDKYINFFKAPQRNHKEISPAPLVLKGDPTTLFTSSGMQPLVPYLMGKKHPKGSRLVNSQPSIRLQDIEEVGDNLHTTFFEMLGNWSLGDYFKKEQLPWIYEFLTKEISLPKDRLWFSIFEGDKKFGVPADDESIKVWKSIGISNERIVPYGVEKNWWSRTGTPGQMPIGDIGGPTSEIFYEFVQVKHNLKHGKKCHINCECGRFMEIGNNVFMEYKKIGEGELEPLPSKNIDFGGGFERIVAATNDEPDIFKTDLFESTISNLEDFVGLKYGSSEKVNVSYRIIADHLRAASYLLAEGVMPDNKLQGYVARRLIRRSVYKLQSLGFDLAGGAISTFARPYAKDFKVISDNWYPLKDAINTEAVKFNAALNRGSRKLDKIIKNNKLDGKTAFDLYQTEGFPLELTLEILEERGIKFDNKDKKLFKEEFEKHKEKSRTASTGMFKGGLADHSDEVTRLHTATHLLQAALREVLGEHVEQRGQNITSERSRFDFSYDSKLTQKELKDVEEWVNDKVNKDLPVKHKLLEKEEAGKTGAIGLFEDKYGDKVNVYYVGESLVKSVSKEFCGGPHVKHTGGIGHVRIKKQEKLGSNLVRIYATIGVEE